MSIVSMGVSSELLVGALISQMAAAVSGWSRDETHTWGFPERFVPGVGVIMPAFVEIDVVTISYQLS